MSIQLAVFISFVLGFSLCFLVLNAFISAHWHKKIEKLGNEQKYHLWLSAWKYCVFRCLDEWNEPIDKFATTCAEETFEDWSKTLE